MSEAVQEIIMVGSMSPAKDPWHAVCSTSSLQQGRALKLTTEGVTDVGLIAGCEKCDSWMMIDLEGNFKDIALRDDDDKEA